MKKISDSLVNMSVVLTATACITGGILAFVNEKTKEPISQVKQKELTEGIAKVMGTKDLQVTSNDTVKKEESVFVVHKVSDNAGKSLGAAVESSTMGFGGELKVLAGFDWEGNILGYQILAHQETPGLGAKAGSWFQKEGKGNIIGKNVKKNPLTVSKDGGEIDAITASTITSRAFLNAVNNAYTALDENAEGLTGATTPNKASKSQTMEGK